MEFVSIFRILRLNEFQNRLGQNCNIESVCSSLERNPFLEGCPTQKVPFKKRNWNWHFLTLDRQSYLRWNSEYLSVSFMALKVVVSHQVFNKWKLKSKISSATDTKFLAKFNFNIYVSSSNKNKMGFATKMDLVKHVRWNYHLSGFKREVVPWIINQ